MLHTVAVGWATRLMRLFTEQLNAMATLKGRTSQPNVTVKHVHVHDGGQAIRRGCECVQERQSNRWEEGRDGEADWALPRFVLPPVPSHTRWRWSATLHCHATP